MDYADKNKKIKVELDFSTLVKKTCYLRKDQHKALKLMAAMEEENEYKIVIEALDKYIPEKYLKMAQNKD